MEREKEHKGVFWVLVCLDLLKHSLSLLKQDQCFFIAFLRDEVYCTFVKLIDDDWHLVFIEVEVFVIVSLEGILNAFVGTTAARPHLVNDAHIADIGPLDLTFTYLFHLYITETSPC